jgi:hypothetical protein
VSIITIRHEPLPDNATVLLQMGRGDVRGTSQLLDNVRRGHDHWFNVLDSCGRFAISVYALAGISEDELLAQLPNAAFGRSTIGAIEDAGFQMLGTTIRIPASVPAHALQPWHFTVLLKSPGLMSELRNDDDLWTTIKPSLAIDLGHLLELFEPRTVRD